MIAKLVLFNNPRTNGYAPWWHILDRYNSFKLFLYKVTQYQFLPNYFEFQGRIQDFLIGGSNLGGGGVDLVILLDYLIFSWFSWKFSMKMNNFVSKGCLSKPHEPPLYPPLNCYQLFLRSVPTPTPQISHSAWQPCLFWIKFVLSFFLSEVIRC